VQFNIEDLNGKTIDLSAKNNKPTKIESGSRRKYSLRRDSTAVHGNIRPVVRNDIDGSTAVGNAFSGTYTISEEISLTLAPQSDAPLPVSACHYRGCGTIGAMALK
jgi:hypothetical protein